MTLRNLANELKEVVEWYQLGISLGIKSYRLDEIRMNRMGDVQHCKLSMLDVWLRGDIYASWNKMVGALDENGHSFVADRIRAKYLGIIAGKFLLVDSIQATANQMAVQRGSSFDLLMVI